MPKLKRSSFNQLEAYVSFLERHPEFLGANNCEENPNFVNEKWNELADKLNSHRGPQRTVDEWKAYLRQWKKQLKCRARRKKAEILLTGCGVPSSDNLSDFEFRALRVFGEVAKATKCEPEFEEPTNSSQNSDCSSSQLLSESFDDSNNSDFLSSDISESASITRKRRNMGLVDLAEKFLKLAEESYESERKLSLERVKIDKKNAESILKMSEALRMIASSFDKLCATNLAKT